MLDDLFVPDPQTGDNSYQVTNTRFVRTLIRELLTSDRTYYVNASTGSDLNNGLSSTTAFATIQKAVNTVAALDISTFNVTVSVAAGTYTGAVTIRDPAGTGTCSILGDNTTPSNVTVSTTSASCFTFTNVRKWNIQGIKVATTTSGFGFILSSGALSTITNCECGTIASGGAWIYVTDAATYAIVRGANNKWSGNCDRLVAVNNLGEVDMAGTMTLLGNVTVGYTVLVNGSSFLQSLMTWTLGAFAVTGTRYIGLSNSLIQTFGAGANYFPGSVAGSVDATSTYQ